MVLVAQAFYHLSSICVWTLSKTANLKQEGTHIMTLRFRSWCWFTRVSSILAIPAVTVVLLEPGHGFEVTAFVFLFGIGTSGAFVAILLRAGRLRFSYTDADRHSIEYRLSSLVRNMEDRSE